MPEIKFKPLVAETGQSLGLGYPEAPAWCTINESFAYQQGVADARALMAWEMERSLAHFDALQKTTTQSL